MALWVSAAYGQDASSVRFEELRPVLPEELWAHRQLFFQDGMQLAVGPAFRDYSPTALYVEAIRKHAGEATLGPDGSLHGYTAGQPFPMHEIDCEKDPQAGVKIAWNFALRWDGARRKASFYFAYFDRGEALPLYFEGSTDGHELAYRVEPQFSAQNGDVLPGDKRIRAWSAQVDAPFDARGIMFITNRYKASLNPTATSKNDDTFVYQPDQRRVRRIVRPQRSEAVAGTDFSFDDLGSFGGIVPQYEWQCLGAHELMAPMNSELRAYPYTRDHDFGPSGLSYANDRWERRRAIKIRMTPRNPDHPYGHKDLYIDIDSTEPLYAFAYDRSGTLWKILWHDHRWSDEVGYAAYEGWPGVDAPRDLTVVSDSIANVQAGTGVRANFWDRDNAAEPSVPKIRRFVAGFRQGCR